MTLPRAPPTMDRVIVPPALERGARIQVVAPSSPFDVRAVRRAIAWLEKRYRVSYAPELFDRAHGFLAGRDAERLRELQHAFDEQDVAAVVSTRGGYGLTRILDQLDWSHFERSPRWLVGFSDMTALHAEAARRGFASLHAANAASLGEADEAARSRWIEALEAPTRARSWTGLPSLRPGCAEGALFGGNLTLLFTLAAAGRLAVPEGAVLLLEDVSETSYRVDRMLTALHTGGHLRRASAVVLGSFTDCSPGKFGVPIEAVLHERLGDLGVPVLAELPVGHGDRNDPLPLGRLARVEAPPAPAAGTLPAGTLSLL